MTARKAPGKKPGNGRSRDGQKRKGFATKPQPVKKAHKKTRIDARAQGNPNLGRPTRLTPELQRLYVEAILKKAPRETAAAFSGIDRHTATEWLRWGSRWRQGLGRDGTTPRNRNDKPFADFHAEVEKAEASAELDLVTIIDRAANGELQGAGQAKAMAPDWKAALELLRRRYRTEWADKVEVHTTHADAEPSADRIADAVLNDADLAEDLTAALGRITSHLQSASADSREKRKGKPV